jgi:hypothetical protein
MPNPVPGADMATLGCPVTVQLFFREPRGSVALALELFAGAPEPANAVEGHVIGPEAPLQIELVPENAWGLIPERELAPKTSYTVRAVWLDRVEVWSFTTGS